MKLLYFTDVIQVNYFIKNKDQFNGFTPITGDITAAFVLLHNKIEFINEWDYLKPHQIQNNWDLANNFSKSWWSELEILLNMDLQAYFESTSQDMVWPLEAIYNSKSVYDEIFSKFKIAEVYGFFQNNKAVIKTGPLPAHKAVRSIAQSILFWIADEKSIPYYKLDLQLELSSENH